MSYPLGRKKAPGIFASKNASDVHQESKTVEKVPDSGFYSDFGDSYPEVQESRPLEYSAAKGNLVHRDYRHDRRVAANTNRFEKQSFHFEPTVQVLGTSPKDNQQMVFGVRKSGPSSRNWNAQGRTSSSHVSGVQKPCGLSYSVSPPSGIGAASAERKPPSQSGERFSQVSGPQQPPGLSNSVSPPSAVIKIVADWKGEGCTERTPATSGAYKRSESLNEEEHQKGGQSQGVSSYRVPQLYSGKKQKKDSSHVSHVKSKSLDSDTGKGEDYSSPKKPKSSDSDRGFRKQTSRVRSKSFGDVYVDNDISPVISNKSVCSDEKSICHTKSFSSDDNSVNRPSYVKSKSYSGERSHEKRVLRPKSKSLDSDSSYEKRVLHVKSKSIHGDESYGAKVCVNETVSPIPNTQSHRTSSKGKDSPKSNGPRREVHYNSNAFDSDGKRKTEEYNRKFQQSDHQSFSDEVSGLSLKTPVLETVNTAMDSEDVDDLYNHLKGTILPDEPYSRLSQAMKDEDSDASESDIWIRNESNVFDPDYNQHEHQRFTGLLNNRSQSTSAPAWDDVPHPHENRDPRSPCACGPAFRTSGGVYDFDEEQRRWLRKTNEPMNVFFYSDDSDDGINYQSKLSPKRNSPLVRSPRLSPQIQRHLTSDASFSVDKIHDVPIRALSDSIRKRRMKNLGATQTYGGSEEFKNVRWRDFFKNKYHMDSRFDDFFDRDLFSSKFEDVLESKPFKRRMSDFEDYMTQRSVSSTASADSFLDFLQTRDEGVGSWSSLSKNSAGSSGSRFSEPGHLLQGPGMFMADSDSDSDQHDPECKYTCHHRCRQLITLDCEGPASESSSVPPPPPPQTALSEESATPNGKTMVKESGEFESGYETNDRPDYSLLPKEDIRRRIEEFNSKNTKHGLLMEMREDGQTFQGFIRVNMNLCRPINMSIGVRPPSIYDVLTHEDIEDDHSQTTSFYLPRDTVKALHITSDTTTREVISLLLHKFHITDNPHKFALYHHFIGDHKKLQVKKLPDGEKPLQLWLKWEEDEPDSQWKLVLQENETGEIMWEAFSVPELANFLEILDREEKEHIDQLRTKYKVRRLQLNAQLREIGKDQQPRGESTA